MSGAAVLDAGRIDRRLRGETGGDGLTAASFDEAVKRHHVALVEFLGGNTEPFKTLYSRSDDATLANPFGGVARGWAEIPARLDRAASYYEDGELLGIDTITADHTGDLGYTLEIERLRARVGGRTTVDEVSLRTTSVFRREGSIWRLVHRHADPAVELRPPQSIV
jgi:ketosteroid isomerase-like protein